MEYKLATDGPALMEHVILEGGEIQTERLIMIL